MARGRYCSGMIMIYRNGIFLDSNYRILFILNVANPCFGNNYGQWCSWPFLARCFTGKACARVVSYASSNELGSRDFAAQEMSDESFFRHPKEKFVAKMCPGWKGMI